MNQLVEPVAPADHLNLSCKETRILSGFLFTNHLKKVCLINLFVRLKLKSSKYKNRIPPGLFFVRLDFEKNTRFAKISLYSSFLINFGVHTLPTLSQCSGYLR
jgi:hypothetical protein